MNPAEFQLVTASKSQFNHSIKNAVKDFAISISSLYPIALTLTIKQTLKIKNANGIFFKKLDVHECEKIAKRFTQKLNREVFGKRAAEKYGKALSYFVVMEGGKNGKNLHLHMAIGSVPDFVSLNDMESIVCKAKQYVEGLDEQHKVDYATNGGWMDYITKEVGRSDSDNVLWQLS